MKKYINVLCVLILALMLGDLILGFFFTSSKNIEHISFDTLSLGSLLGLLAQIFTPKNVSLLRKYGTCAILIGIGITVFTVAIVTEKSFTDALIDGIDALVEGCFALLMGEVFKIGIDLQEGKHAA